MTPAALRLVESFLNSIDVEEGRDSLETWLPGPTTPAELARARELRDTLRASLAGAETDLDAIAAEFPLVIRGMRLVPAPRTSQPVLAEILAAVALAAHDGTWRRLKICPAEDCRWVYYDHSKNTSRRWCSMRVCGNRSKTRRYRERQSGDARAT